MHLQAANLIAYLLLYLIHRPIIKIGICGDHPVVLTRANILVDLWMVSAGPFLKAPIAAIFRGEIHRGNPVLNFGRNKYGYDFAFSQTNRNPLPKNIREFLCIDKFKLPYILTNKFG